MNTEKLDKFGKLEFRKVCTIRWRIQDFAEVGAPNPKVYVKSYYLAHFFLQKCMKLKEFGPRGVDASLAPPKSVNVIFLCSGQSEVKKIILVKPSLREMRLNPREVILCGAMSHTCDYSLLDVYFY